MFKHAVIMASVLVIAGAVTGCGTMKRWLGRSPAVGAPEMRWDRGNSTTNATSSVANTAAAKETEVERLAAENKGPAAPVVAYRLRSGDVVTIAIRAPQVENFEMVVDEYGNIKLPYIDTVQALGLTTAELESRIKRTYIDKKIYKMLTVNVFIPLRSYYVRGEVRQPGRFALTTGMTLVQAIATAGGFTDFADAGDIRILRGDKKLKFNVKDLEAHPEKDVDLETNDIIIVTRSFL